MNIAAGFGDKDQIIAQQAARIAELEAENARLKDACNKFSEAEILEGDKLAALRKKIEDAPVVAWKMKGVPAFATSHEEGWIPLISREDI